MHWPRGSATVLPVASTSRVRSLPCSSSPMCGVGAPVPLLAVARPRAPYAVLVLAAALSG